MNFINRALTNVRRNLSKSALLLITFFVIGNFVILGLAVTNASENAKIETRKQMKAIVTLTVDYEAFYNDGSKLPVDEQDQFYLDNQPELTNDLILEMAADDKVVAIDAQSVNIGYTPTDIESVKINNDQNSDNSYCYTDENGNEICQTYNSPDIAVVGNQLPNMIEFVDGTYELVAGSLYTQADIDNNNKVMLVTEEFAQLNGLNVDDTFRVFLDDPSSLTDQTSPDYQVSEDDISIEMKIIGIFKNNNVLDENSKDFKYKQTFEAPGNMILVPASTINNFNYQRAVTQWQIAKDLYPDEEYYQDDANLPKEKDYEYIQSAVFLLNDPLNVDTFVSDHSSQLKDYIILDANNEMFQQLAKPLDTMSMFANFVVWLVIINAIIIITLVTALTLKNREYEIGCLLSLGTSKFKIIAQFFIELAIIAIIGFSLSVVSGSLIANKVGQSVWQAQSTYDGIVQLGAETTDEYDNSFWNPSAAHVTEINYQDISDNYQATVSPVIIGEIYLAGLFIVLIAIIIPSLMIMRFSPKRILMSSQ